MPVKTIKEFPTGVEMEKPGFKSMLGVPYEQRFGEWIMINEGVLREEIAKLTDELVQEKLNKYLEERELLRFREVNDVLAQKELTDFILQMKETGISKINILDIVINLNLPPEQIERIMTKFEKEKRVTKAL